MGREARQFMELLEAHVHVVDSCKAILAALVAVTLRH